MEPGEQAAMNRKRMNNLAFENPLRYGMTMGGIFAVVFFGITLLESAIGWDLYRNIYGAIAGTLFTAAFFGAGMTWWTRSTSSPTL